MIPLLDRLDELRDSLRVDAACPVCGMLQEWWDGSIGPDCGNEGCDYQLHLWAPPIIMCSRCGGDLALAGAGYWCEPCDRTVS